MTGADGITRTRVETGHGRLLTTLFGTVRVTRCAWRRPGTGNLCPADTALSLPAPRHSHTVARLAVQEAARGSFRLIHQVPGLLAGAAVIAATQPAPDDFLLADAPPVPLPVVLIHGTRDPIVAYEGGAMSWWVRRFFRAGGICLSAPQTAAYFAARNAITQAPAAMDLPHREESGKTSVTRTDYRQDGMLPVTLYTVHGGGHTIPGPRQAPFVLGRTTRDLNAAEAIGQFFGLMLTRTAEDPVVDRPEAPFPAGLPPEGK